MMLLVDSHTLIWFSVNSSQWSGFARTLLEAVTTTVLVTPASIWEVAIKVSIGKLASQRSYDDFLDLLLGPYGFQMLPIEPAHTKQLAILPYPTRHKDSFDRLLIAQAIIEGIPILSADAAFDDDAVQRIW